MREAASWRAPVDDGTNLVFAYLGHDKLSLRSGFRGVALAPHSTLVLEPNGVFEGTFYGRSVKVGSGSTVRKLSSPLFGIDFEGCALQVPIRSNLPPREREIAFQEDIVRQCSAPGISRCQAQLIARANVDYTAAAARVVAGLFSPAQYLSLSRDRTRKLRAAQENAVVATQRCLSSDSDGDGVIDALDQCPSTTDLTATDDVGCPVSSLPPAPSRDDVLRVLSNMHLAVSPKCQYDPVPPRIPAGAFYYPSNRERGTYILAGQVLTQKPGCPVWYEFEVEELTGPSAGDRYSVAFLDREAKADLVDLGRPVPPGFVQFNPRPGAINNRNRLATAGGVVGIRYRVRAMNGNGVRGEWSEYKISDRRSCTALGFTCPGGD